MSLRGQGEIDGSMHWVRVGKSANQYCTTILPCSGIGLPSRNTDPLHRVIKCGNNVTLTQIMGNLTATDYLHYLRSALTCVA